MSKATWLFLCFLSTALTASFAQTFLSAWGDGEHQTAVFLDGNRYFIETEQGRLGPFDDVSPKTRAAAAVTRSFKVKTKAGAFVVGASGEQFGPYQFVFDHPSGRLFHCSYPDPQKKYDILFDNGSALVLLGTTSQGVTADFSRLSSDGKHSYVKLGVEIRETQHALYDSYALPLNHRTKIGMRSFGFEGARLWLGTERFSSGWNLLFVEPDPESGQPFISALTAAPGHEGHRVVYPEALTGGVLEMEDRKPLAISKFIDSYITSDGAHRIVKFEAAGGLHLYDGENLYGPFGYGHGSEPEKWPMRISSDGQTSAFVIYGEDQASGKLRHFVYKNGALLGSIDAQKIVAMELAADSGACVTVAQGWNSLYSVWVDGTPVLDGCAQAQLLRVDAETGSTFLGHVSSKKDGTTALYHLGRKVTTDYEKPGYFFMRHDEVNEELRIFYYATASSTDQILVEGDRASEPYKRIHGVSVSGGVVAYAAVDSKGKSFVVVGDQRFGPYDACSRPRQSTGASVATFFYAKGKSWFLGRSDGTRAPLPGFGYTSDTSDRETAPLVSADGRVVEYPAVVNVYSLFNKRMEPAESRKLLVDGVARVGTYNREARTTVYWDTKSKAFVTIRH